ncbi:ankyrin repeat protein [Anaeramoeba flamelloides]|uniref:Ankyrin repeat domain-containing protein 54 n=1 Tax=Anaeramoeba flamelloides TaxID=1746091 RepID=A0ABQ8ZCR6_9EUKA|nr:ankyrin repeat protein [Anaeramoeba flamelloides]
MTSKNTQVSSERCQLCKRNPPNLHCKKCYVSFCLGCEKKLHSGKIKTFHSMYTEEFHSWHKKELIKKKEKDLQEIKKEKMNEIKKEQQKYQKQVQGQKQNLSYGRVKEKETVFIYNDESKYYDAEGNNRLHLYLLKSKELDLQIMKQIIKENHCQKSEINHKLQTYLHCLCSNPLVTIELIEFFIDQGLDLNALDKNKMNCLFTLCTYKNISIKLITYLVNSGISINQLDSDQNSLLHLMCKNHPQMINLELFQFLKKNNFKFNIKTISKYQTALHLFCKQPNNKNLKPKFLQLFIDFGIMDINQLDGHQRTILYTISEYNTKMINLELFQFLKKNNFNFNYKNWRNETVLHLYCWQPNNPNLNLETLQLFIDFGYNINQSALDNCFSYLAINNPKMINLELFQFLKLNKFNFNVKNSKNKNIIETLLTMRNKYLNPKLIQLFISGGFDINQLNYQNNTILHLICENKPEMINLELFQILKMNNFNFNVRNPYNQTALELFCSNPNIYFNLESIQLFIEFGMDINELYHQKKSILHMIFLYYPKMITLELLQFLKKYKFNFNLKDSRNQNVLHYYVNQTKKSNLNLELIQLFIEFGMDINQLDIEKNSIFHYICQKNPKMINLELFQLFKENNFNFNIKNSKNENVLHNYFWASSKINYLNLESIQLFIDFGVDTKHLGPDKNSILHLICRNNPEMINLELFQILKQNNFNFNVKNFKNENALHNYFSTSTNIKYLNLELIQLFIEFGMDINQLDGNKKTIFHLICQNNPKMINLELFQFLKKNNFNFNVKDSLNQTAFHTFFLERYIKYLNLDSIQLFIEFGMDVNQLDGKKNSILHLICQNNPKMINLELFQFLKKNNFNFTIKNSFNQTALHVFCQKPNNPYINPKSIQLFLDFGINVNQLDYRKNSILHLICQNNPKMINLELFQFLKNLNFKFEIKNEFKENVLHSFCQGPDNIFINPDSIKSFIRFGRMDINQLDSKKNSILHMICQHNPKMINLELFQFLKLNKFKFNIQNKINQSPLHVFCQKPENPYLNRNSIQLFFDFGNKINQRDSNLKTILHLIYHENMKIIDLDLIKMFKKNKYKFKRKDRSDQTALQYFNRRTKPRLYNVELHKYLKTLDKNLL